MPVPTGPASEKPPGLTTCFLTLGVTRLGLRLFGFRRTVRGVRWMAARYRTGAADGSPARVARAVATAAAFFPGRAVCLEQSIALYLLLRRRGLPAALQVGVQPYPFQAHAWVEVDGRPLNENEDTIKKFVPFPRVFA